MFTDYGYHRKLFKDTAMVGRIGYQSNWVHVDDWSTLNVESEKKLSVPAENVVSGLDMGNCHTWTFECTATAFAAQIAHYTWIIGYKRLRINPGEIGLLSSAPGDVVLMTTAGAPVVTLGRTHKHT